ncbi:MAG: hypothetical protein ABI600_15515 [Luteolibacter sp.]
MKLKESLRFAIFFSSLECGIALADSIPQNILSEPDFVQRGDTIVGWKSSGFVGTNSSTGKVYENSAKIKTEADKTFIRITCDPNFANFAFSPDNRLPLLPAWSALTVSASIQINAFTKNDEWGGFNLWLVFYDFDGKEITNAGDSFLRVSHNQMWTSVQKTLSVPKGATEVAIQLRWLAAGGVADVRNLVLKPQ